MYNFLMFLIVVGSLGLILFLFAGAIFLWEGDYETAMYVGIFSIVLFIIAFTAYVFSQPYRYEIARIAAAAEAAEVKTWKDQGCWVYETECGGKSKFTCTKRTTGPLDIKIAQNTFVKSFQNCGTD